MNNMPLSPIFDTGKGFHMGKRSSKKVIRRRKKNTKNNCIILQNEPIVCPDMFNSYEGFRWKVPSGVHLSWGERIKFELLNTCNSNNFMNTFMKVMQSRSFIIKQSSISSNNSSIMKIAEPFELCPVGIAYLKSLKTRDNIEWLRVKRLYLVIFSFVRLIKGAIMQRLRKLCLKNLVNTEDIVTLEVPKNPVYVFNFRRRISYVYEASTIKRAINERLLSSDYMFAEPRTPLNILSNEPFTYNQCVSIYYQLKAYGLSSWALELYKKYGFDIHKFELYCSQQLKLSAIHNHFNHESYLSFETVYDFFTVIADSVGIEEMYISNFRNIYLQDYINLPPYLKLWKDLTYRKYLAQVANDNVTADKIIVESMELVKKIYDIPLPLTGFYGI